MIDKIINDLTIAIMMHEKLMVEFQKIEMQGMKRFNRYESVEMLKRLNKVKNYAVEFNHPINEAPVSYQLPTGQSVTTLIKLVADSRSSMHADVMAAMGNCKEMAFYNILKEMAEDLEKEFEVFNRILNAIKPLTSNDTKWLVLREFDSNMHEYIKNKEK